MSKPLQESTLTAAIDPITLAVIHNNLMMVTSEMDLTQEKTSFSPIISEAMDRANGIYAAESGELIVQGLRGLPLFIGVMQATVKAVIDRRGGLQPGRVVSDVQVEDHTRIAFPRPAQETLLVLFDQPDRAVDHVRFLLAQHQPRLFHKVHEC